MFAAVSGGCAELELSIHHRKEGEYTVGFRFNQPGSAVSVRLGQEEAAWFHLDLIYLQAQSRDPEKYAQTLTEAFFHQAQVKTLFAKALASAQSLNVPLRVRLLIEPSAPELQNVYWEQLLDPDDGSPLFTGEKIFFSRYLAVMNLRPVKLGPKASLSALVFIANPNNLAQYQFSAIDVEDEFQRAEEGLGSVTVQRYSGPATLECLVEELRAKKPSILYLVCHGAMLRDEPYLCLENRDGQAAIIPGKELVTRLKELNDLPLLVVLPACESAGTGAGDARAALGPRLSGAGIPAVVAMQGSVSMETVAKFMPVFFSELQKDGQIDRAMSLARGAVREQPDSWMPVLFTHLNDGCLFARPGPVPEPPKVNWRLRAAVGITILLLLLGMGGGFLAINRPRAMGGGFNVAVARFAELDKQGRLVNPEHGKIVSEGLYTAIENAMKQMSVNSQFEMRRPRDVGVVWNEDSVQMDRLAEDTANKWNAGLLIYGVVRETDTGFQVEPFFRIRDEGFRYGSEVAGSSRLGKPVKVDFDISKDTKKLIDLNTDLNERVQILKKLIDGLSNFYMEEYDPAVVSFQQALDLPGWEEQSGQEVLYVLIGSAQLRAYDSFNRDQSQVQQAVHSFENAIAANPKYARAYLGLGSAKLMQAHRFDGNQMNALLEARDWVKTALQQPDQPESAYVSLKASLILGEISLVGAAQGFPGFDLDQSTKYFLQVLDDYEAAQRPDDLVYYAANALYLLGHINGLGGDWKGMIGQCTLSSQELERLPFTSRYLTHLKAQAYFCAGVAHARLKEYDQAKPLIEKAVKDGGKYATQAELNEWNTELSKLP